MINNFKLYVLISLFMATIICCAAQRLQLIRVRAQLNACTTQQQVARMIYNQQVEDLQNKEEAADRARNEAENRMKLTMEDEVKPGCEQAMRYGRDYARKFKE